MQFDANFSIQRSSIWFLCLPLWPHVRFSSFYLWGERTSKPLILLLYQQESHAVFPHQGKQIRRLPLLVVSFPKISDCRYSTDDALCGGSDASNSSIVVFDGNGGRRRHLLKTICTPGVTKKNYQAQVWQLLCNNCRWRGRRRLQTDKLPAVSVPPGSWPCLISRREIHLS